MHLKVFFWLLFSVTGLVGFAQNESFIHLIVLDEQQQPLANTTVTLRFRKDSSIIKVQLTDTAGCAVFENLSAGDYFLQITHSGFIPYSSSHFFIPQNFELKLPAVSLQPSSSSLANVIVSAHKPLVEMKPGKTAVNLEAGISTIGTSLSVDVLPFRKDSAFC